MTLTLTARARAAVLGLVLALTAGLAAVAQQADAAEPYRKVVADVRKTPNVNGPHVHLRVADLNALFDLSQGRFREQLRMLKAEKPHVILLQEVADRTRVLKTWAARNGYRVYLPGGTRDTWKNHSVVLWKNNGRFRVLGYEARVGSDALTRPGGGHVGRRYLATVRVLDRVSRQPLAFTSTHASPDTFVRSADGWRPRWGTATLAGFRRHMRAIRSLVLANKGAITILGGDLNSPARHEHKWAGFQTQRFGDLLRSNHQALGHVGTLTTRDGAAIDYLYLTKTRRIDFAHQRVIDNYSDHHALVADLRVAQR